MVAIQRVAWKLILSNFLCKLQAVLSSSTFKDSTEIIMENEMINTGEVRLNSSTKSPYSAGNA